MQLLDPALGVAAVAAEVELAARARGARHGVGPADDADDEVAGREAAAVGRLEHAAERLVAEDQPLLARRRPAVLAVDDLAVGAADAERDPVDEQLARARLGLGHVDDGGRAGLQRDHGECAHVCLPTAGIPTSIVRRPAYAASHPATTSPAHRTSIAAHGVTIAIHGPATRLRSRSRCRSRSPCSTHDRLEPVITSAALLVPFVLAVIGDRARDGDHRPWSRSRSGSAACSGTTRRAPARRSTGSSSTALVALLAVVAARARERATELADDNQALARDLRCPAGAARRHPRLARRGGHRPRRARQDRLRERGRRRAARLRERRGGARRAEPGELAARFTITHEDGSPVAVDDLPGRRLSQGEHAPALLTRSIRRDTGEAFWLLTKATLTQRPDGAPARDQHHRGRHRRQGRRAAPALPRRGRPAARLLARLRADARARRPHDRPAAGRLVRRSTCSTSRATSQQVAVAHVDPAKVAAGARAAPSATRPTPTRRPACPAILRGGPAELYREIPDELLEQAAQRRGAPAVDPRARDALGDGRADADRRRDARRDHARRRRERPPRSTTTTSRSPRTSRCAPRPRSRTRACTRRRSASRTRCRPACCPSACPSCRAGRSHAAYQAGERGADVGGDFYDILPVDGGHLVVLGDVTGKGIEAAALTSLVRHSARIAARFDPQPGARAGARQRGAARAAAAVAGDARCARWCDRRRPRAVTVASAGPPAAAARAARARRRAARRPRRPARRRRRGRLDRERPSSSRPATRCCFYTDGVTETPGDGDALRRAAPARGDRARGRRRPIALLAEIERSLRDFQAGAALDDRAMLALRFLGAHAAAA